MANNNITKTTSGTVDGNLRFLSANGFDTKVRLELLNEKKNRNNWIYKNIKDHLNEFLGTPILISYKGGQLGAGHEMDEVRNADGTVGRSFMSADAERIVGYIPENAEMRIEVINGVEWVVTDDAVIFGWYAPELSERLKGTGTLSEEEKEERSMRVSIETLIDEGYVEADGTEVFTRWRVLGTTVLNQPEAVVGANIRSLSAIGVDQLREMTRLRVASAKEAQSNPQNKKRKGETQTMELKDLQPKFNGYSVIAVDGENVALLSDKGVPHLSTVKKDGDDYIIGENTEVKACAVFENGEEKIEIPLASVTAPYIEKCNELQQNLDKANAAKSEVDAKLASFMEAEKERRKASVKETIVNRFNAIVESQDVEIPETICDELKADEKVNAYADMEDEEGNFCGNNAAEKDVDALCMNAILSAAKAKKSETPAYSWDDSDKPAEDVSDAIADILK